ncbi:alpha/beta hydrolase [Thiohalophilus thiocyanatoxydans]|uniref:Pimeloyl-ACP methyl ester carboxylesterase n=1 Tax=Thiohalophilus thiocyanatoxydans TaxID=381308 RepID=A0A4R8ITT6_9GAMM|nr:alpha/beta fold hydrolase [Thiohalophilus thiocyanatoxydans]TDY02840.1 pimeloyl-ACP methyl ester carboxylesterase [Thiohalophilus thiocyanatoxydans]
MRLRDIFTLLLITMALGSGAAQAKQVQTDYEDLKLNAELVQADGSSLEEGVVLMVHGTLAHGQMEIMKGLQNVFKEYGINSLAINLSLGQSDREGMYDCDDTHRHKHTDAVDEVAHWLNWLKEQGADNITLLGHSRGGNQAAWFAAEQNDPALKEVVLIAPQMWDMKYERKNYKERYDTALQPIFNKAKKLVKKGKGDTLLKNTDFIYCEDTTVSAESFVNYYKDDERKDTPGLLKQIDKPVLVIAGTEDNVVKGLEKRVEPLADGEKVKLEVIDGANHMFRDLYLYDIADQVQALIDARS